MKKIILIISFLAYIITIEAQDIARNNIYLELGGPAYLYSVNYEYLLSNNKDINFPIRIGVFYNSPNEYFGFANYGIPLSISIIKKMSGNSTMYFELKALVTIAYYKKSNTMGHGQAFTYYTTRQYTPGVSFGIRRQPAKGGFYYHLNMQISYDKELSKKIIIWPALGIGLTF